MGIITWGIFAVLAYQRSQQNKIVLSTPTPNPKLLYKQGNSSSTELQLMKFKGCGPKLSQYEFSIKLPANWDIYKREFPDFESVYYDAINSERQLTIGCTTLGVGGGLCDEQSKLTDFVVNGEKVSACYGQTNGRWVLGTLNLSTDPSTQATIAFWADGLEPSLLKSILSTFKSVKN
jgi:hypothetical protein